MAWTNTSSAAFYNLLGEGIPWADVGDATGLRNSTISGSLYMSLHTAAPTAAGTQATNETSYTNYTRIALARGAGAFTIVANVMSNTGTVTFPTCGVTGATLTHFGLGVASSGATQLIFFGALTSPVTIVLLDPVVFGAGAATFTAQVTI